MITQIELAAAQKWYNEQRGFEEIWPPVFELDWDWFGLKQCGPKLVREPAQLAWTGRKTKGRRCTWVELSVRLRVAWDVLARGLAVRTNLGMDDAKGATGRRSLARGHVN